MKENWTNEFFCRKLPRFLLFLDEEVFPQLREDVLLFKLSYFVSLFDQTREIKLRSQKSSQELHCYFQYYPKTTDKTIII